MGNGKDTKFCTQVIGKDLHQMVRSYKNLEKNISSAAMLKRKHSGDPYIEFITNIFR